MSKLFPIPAAKAAPAVVSTMQHVHDWIVAQAPDPVAPKVGNPHGFRLQYLTTLASHCGDVALSLLPADLSWFDETFPKVVKGVHPRPELGQRVAAYKKWRQNTRKAIEIATGIQAEKDALRAREDGWAELLAAIALHSAESGIIAPQKASPVQKLAEIARRAEIEPWNLAQEDALSRLEEAFTAPQDRQISRRAQRVLRTFGFLPELSRLLPATPVPVFPSLREKAALPEHVDTFIGELIERAGAQRDEVAGKDSQVVKDSTKDGWRAALRHHLRALPHCPAEPRLGYVRPVTDLSTVNDPSVLFERDLLFATIRYTEAVEHLPGTISHVSAYDYYTTLLTVLARNELIDGNTCNAIKTCKFMKDGRELAQGMTEANAAWCKALVQGPEKRRRFRNLHRIFMARAEDVLATAESEGRLLTKSEIVKARQLGTCAAAAAIEYAGRPIRLANVLGLRLKGSQANFFKPGKGRETWEFHLCAHETKSGRKEAATPLNAKLYGPQVLSWYLARIRPLYPHADANIHLFPAVESAAGALGKKTFDGWFQRAASEANLPMSFHKWRHGYASLLLAADWGNLPHAAAMLGNTAAVCARNYAWIDDEKLILDGQEKQVAAAEADQ